MTGVENLGLAASLSFGQPVQSAFRASAIGRSSDGEGTGRRNDRDEAGGVTATISAAGQLLGNLQQLLNQDPTKFQQVLTQIAGQLQDATQPVGPNGPSQSAPTSNGSAAPLTAATTPITTTSPTPETTPSSAPDSAPTPAPPAISGSAATTSTNSATSTDQQQGPSELSQIFSFFANLFQDIAKVVDRFLTRGNGHDDDDSQTTGATPASGSTGAQPATVPSSPPAGSASPVAAPTLGGAPASAPDPATVPTSTSNPANSTNLEASSVPVTTPASSTSTVTATTTGSTVAGSTGSTTTTTPAQGQSELSQLLSFVTNLFQDIFQSGNIFQSMGRHHGHHGHATYNQQGGLVPTTTSGTSSATSTTSIQQLIQNLADEVGQALGSTTK